MKYLRKIIESKNYKYQNDIDKLNDILFNVIHFYDLNNENIEEYINDINKTIESLKQNKDNSEKVKKLHKAFRYENFL